MSKNVSQHDAKILDHRSRSIAPALGSQKPINESRKLPTVGTGRSRRHHWHTRSLAGLQRLACYTTFRGGGSCVLSRHNRRGQSSPGLCDRVGHMLYMDRWHAYSIDSGRRSSARQLDSTCWKRLISCGTDVEELGENGSGNDVEVKLAKAQSKMRSQLIRGDSQKWLKMAENG